MQGETTMTVNGSYIQTTAEAAPVMKQYQQIGQPDITIILAFKIILLIAILIVNGFVLVVYSKFPKIRVQPHNVFIIALAITDFLTGIVSIPMDIFKNVTPDFFDPTAPVPWYYTNKELCLFGLFSVIQPLQWSATTLVIIAMDRFVATFFPLKYYSIVTRKRAALAVVIGWIVSSIPLYTATAMTDLETHDPQQRCTTGRQFHPQLEKTIFYVWSAIPIGISILIYVAIWIRLCRHREQVENQKQQTVTMAVVILAFTVCLLPLFVAMHRVAGLSKHEYFVFVFTAIFLAHSNSVMNPIIYNVFNSRFRKCSRELLCPGRNQSAEVTTVSNGVDHKHQNGIDTDTV